MDNVRSAFSLGCLNLEASREVFRDGSREVDSLVGLNATQLFCLREFMKTVSKFISNEHNSRNEDCESTPMLQRLPVINQKKFTSRAESSCNLGTSYR